MEFNATFLVSIISFILFTVIMNKIFYKPLEKIMSEREQYIDETLKAAQYSSDKADAIINDKEERLKKSTVDAKQIINAKISEANEFANGLLSNAKQKSQSDIETAKQALTKDALELDNNLEPEIRNLAGVISSKILGFDTKIEDVK